MLRNLALAAMLAVAAGPAPAQLFAPQDILEPEKAFRISARALDEHHVEVEFRIAEGYYLYRDRFSLATEWGKPLAVVVRSDEGLLVRIEPRAAPDCDTPIEKLAEFGRRMGANSTRRGSSKTASATRAPCLWKASSVRR